MLIPLKLPPAGGVFRFKNCPACGADDWRIKPRRGHIYFDCRPCSDKRNRDWRRDNPELKRERDARWYARNKHKSLPKGRAYAAAHQEAFMVSRAKTRARKIGVPFDLTVEDIVIPERCPALGVPLVRGTGKPHQFSPSLDRIDNSRGYVRGNVVVVSRLANNIKADAASAAQVRAVADWMERLCL